MQFNAFGLFIKRLITLGAYSSPARPPCFETSAMNANLAALWCQPLPTQRMSGRVISDGHSCSFEAHVRRISSDLTAKDRRSQLLGQSAAGDRNNQSLTRPCRSLNRSRRRRWRHCLIVSYIVSLHLGSRYSADHQSVRSWS